MTPLESEILKHQEKLYELRKQQRQIKLREAKALRPAKPRGRPRISDEVLIKVVRDAEHKTLREAAMKHNVSMTTLLRRNIKRCVLEQIPPHLAK